jgi:hypothetical protein
MFEAFIMCVLAAFAGTCGTFLIAVLLTDSTVERASRGGRFAGLGAEEPERPLARASSRATLLRDTGTRRDASAGRRWVSKLERPERCVVHTGAGSSSGAVTTSTLHDTRSSSRRSSRPSHQRENTPRR